MANQTTLQKIATSEEIKMYYKEFKLGNEGVVVVDRDLVWSKYALVLTPAKRQVSMVVQNMVVKYICDPI